MKRLDLLDYSRLVAALAVMAFHYLYNGIQGGKIQGIDYFPHVVDFAKYGYLGVEFFFMISGYVIFFSCQDKTPGQFAVSRLQRLYPAFWFAVLFTAFFAYFWGGEQMSVAGAQVLANLTMAAPHLGFDYVDGVYWTLLYELKFYLAVFLLMLLGQGKRLVPIFLLWPFALVMVKFMGWKFLPLSDGYHGFFAAGAVLAILKFKLSKFAWISLVVCLYLCVTFAIDKATMLATRKAIYYSMPIIWMAIVAFFTVFLFVNTKAGSELDLKGARLAGGLTYPIYLIHAHFGYMVIDQFATEMNKASIYLLTIGLVFAVALFIHLVIEQRLKWLWSGLFKRLIGRPIDVVSLKALRG